MFENLFNGMFKPVANGCCKLGMDGKIAVKTSTGYKTFDLANKRLVNCDNFAFDADGAFWIIPTFSVAKGELRLSLMKTLLLIQLFPSTTYLWARHIAMEKSFLLLLIC